MLYDIEHEDKYEVSSRWRQTIKHIYTRTAQHNSNTRNRLQTEKQQGVVNTWNVAKNKPKGAVERSVRVNEILY